MSFCHYQIPKSFRLLPENELNFQLVSLFLEEWLFVATATHVLTLFWHIPNIDPRKWLSFVQVEMKSDIYFGELGARHGSGSERTLSDTRLSESCTLLGLIQATGWTKSVLLCDLTKVDSFHACLNQSKRNDLHCLYLADETLTVSQHEERRSPACVQRQLGAILTEKAPKFALLWPAEHRHTIQGWDKQIMTRNMYVEGGD